MLTHIALLFLGGRGALGRMLTRRSGDHAQVFLILYCISETIEQHQHKMYIWIPVIGFIYIITTLYLSLLVIMNISELDTPYSCKGFSSPFSNHVLMQLFCQETDTVSEGAYFFTTLIL